MASLYKKMKAYRIDCKEKYSAISDHELDYTIKQIYQDQHKMGEVMLMVTWHQKGLMFNGNVSTKQFTGMILLVGQSTTSKRREIIETWMSPSHHHLKRVRGIRNRGPPQCGQWTDIFCLHYVYLPRINQALTNHMNAHNHHKISSEESATPLQLVTIYAIFL